MLDLVSLVLCSTLFAYETPLSTPAFYSSIGQLIVIMIKNIYFTVFRINC